MRNRNNGINIRVTAQEKFTLTRHARKCKLSLSEYLRQTALGHTPKEAPPIEYHHLIGLLTELYAKPQSPETQTEILSTLKIMQSAFFNGD